MKSSQDRIHDSLRRLMEEHGVDMATVSKAIGKNHAYIQQYLNRGIPAELSYKTAMALANFFGTELDMFGIHTGRAASNDQKAKRHPVETIRRMMGMTAAQFGAALGSDAKTIEGIEKGRVPLTESLLFKICQTFQVEPEDLREFVPQFSDEERQIIFQLRQMSPKQKKTALNLMRQVSKDKVG